MTLTVRLHVHHACIQDRVASWSGPCPNCRHELQVSVSAKRPLCAMPLSPHTPLTPPFLFKPSYFVPYSPAISPFEDSLKKLDDTKKALMISGWYYGHLDWQGARNLLKDASVGAFLIRNSGDSNFIFSLSVQTDRGPTSVRLHFEEGLFRLDCDRIMTRYMPKFKCVVELIEYYTRINPGSVWVDQTGCPHSPVMLRSPLRKEAPTLMHLARLAIHRSLNSNPLIPKLWSAPKHRLLPLPSTLIDYLGEYPFSV